VSIYRYRDRAFAQDVLTRLKAMGLRLHIMHVCGTHQDTLTRSGVDSLLEACGVEVRQGPGCPVCVTTAREFEEAAVLARTGKTILTFGDVAKVPGRGGSLLDLRGEGHDVRVVYGIGDAVAVARDEAKDVVFMAAGFETTAPTTAAMVLAGLPENFTVLSCHRYLPPALNALLAMGEFRLDGIIEPGHVSAIIGLKPYEPLSTRYGVPQVVAGFEPLDLLMAVYMLAQQIQRGDATVENEYTRVVRPEGNRRALDAMHRVFDASDVAWRGFPVIPRSGMTLKRQFEAWDARKAWEDDLQRVDAVVEETSGCRCGDVLRGLLESRGCPLFGTACTPTHPVGPCMVSVEGACHIDFTYKKN
jgi:hydrogenase expression/formation protein HypD